MQEIPFSRESGEEATHFPIIRRESWVTLQGRKMLDTPLHSQNNLLMMEEEKNSPNALRAPFSTFLHLFTLLLCATRSMKCKLCDHIFIDVTVLNCGHAFCKFCLTAWFQTKMFCPTCLKLEVHPVCNRCYQLDSLAESFYRHFLEIFNLVSLPPTIVESSFSLNGNAAVGNTSRYNVNNVPLSQLKLFNMNKRLEAFRMVHKTRKDRRDTLANCSCVNKSCPNRSMLQGVGDLGFGLRSSIQGFILIVIGSFFLGLSACQFSDLLEKLELVGLRRIYYVVLIMYLICTQRVPFIRSEDISRNIFWDQILKTTVTEERDPFFQNEKARMNLLVRQNEIDFHAVEREILNIVEALGGLDLN